MSKAVVSRLEIARVKTPLPMTLFGALLGFFGEKYPDSYVTQEENYMVVYVDVQEEVL